VKALVIVGVYFSLFWLLMPIGCWLASVWCRLRKRTAPVPPPLRSVAVRLTDITAVGILTGWLTYSQIVVPIGRSLDSGTIHTVALAWLKWESDHPNGLPPDAEIDIHGLAAQLALSGLIAEPKFWISDIDESFVGTEIPRTIFALKGDRTIVALDPEFQVAALVPAFALLPKIDPKLLPAETPIVWTRGLESDGNWADDSPYGNWGGFIVFADGSAKTFKGSIAGGLVKWGTKIPTSNILEALPPGTRILEYKRPPISPPAK
jgi:hypothetical protein